jgi:formamidopyrimidine-DNA glycosylase
MPELPEVETTRCGIAPVLEGAQITELVVREPRLRWPVPADMADRLRGQTVHSVKRRAKYLLLETDNGCAMVHLGMSGSLRIVSTHDAPERHDHFDIITAHGDIVRFNDPRRFGSLLWAGSEPEQHPLLVGLGPEPLEDGFTGKYLWESARGRKIAIKQHIMNSKIVAGIGNIYANEALFRAGIHPRRQAGRIALRRLEKLAQAIRAVLNEAIQQGGTTLRDYRNSDGKPGYFRQKLLVYERAPEPCRKCNEPIVHIVQGQRSTYYCKRCQR